MAIGVTQVSQFLDQAAPGQYLRYGRLDVTGLTVNANNTVPHGLVNPMTGAGMKPLQLSIEPTSNNNFYEYQSADVTNIYIGVGSGTGTTVSIYVTY